MKWNRIKNANRIIKGQRLRVRSSKRKKGTSYERIPPFTISHPVPGARLVKGFRPFGDSRHYGLLYRTSSSQGVRSARKGRVVKVANMRGYGTYILVDHGSGWITMYSNMARVFVRTGQTVTTRQNLGKARSGRFQFLLSFKGKPVNPVRYL